MLLKIIIDRDVEAGKSSSKDNSKGNSENNNKHNKKDKEFQDKINVDLDKPIKTLYYKYITLILL